MNHVALSDPMSLERAVATLRAGGVVVYPTETAYAIGVDATNPAAVSKIYALKGRDEGKPVPVIAGSLVQVREYVAVPPEAAVLAAQYWPGPLTLVLPAHDQVLARTLRSEGDIALRISGLAWCRELALALGRPVTSTSANASGTLTEYSLEGVRQSLGERAEMIDLWVDGGALLGGPVSTIVRLASGYELIREGAIPGEEIKKLLE